jgi:hypothetical protein
MNRTVARVLPRRTGAGGYQRYAEYGGQQKRKKAL